MIKREFKVGDKVFGILSGYYYKQYGTIVKRSQVQYGRDTRYTIELDIGITIVLESKYIKYQSEKDYDICDSRSKKYFRTLEEAYEYRRKYGE